VHHVANVIGSDFHIDLARSRWIRTVTGWQHHVQAVACESRSMTADFQRMYPDVPNVQTVYRGVDLELFNPFCIPAIPRTNDSIRFLFLGGFPHYAGPNGSDTKGGWTLCKAWKAAEPELFESGARLFLGGPDIESRRLGRWLRTLRHPERITLLGCIAPAKMPEVMCSCDVVLIPSFVEGLPNVVLEASACGRAVIGSRIGGLEDVVEHGDTGFLVEAGNVAAWADILASQARLRAPLKSMGERSRKRVEAVFDSRQYSGKMLALYAQALNEPLTPSSGRSGRRPSGGTGEVQDPEPAAHGGGAQ
jgi:glycosyltransferase involved in cell wall biosynthesis